ncbi:CopG family transcriptional regulator [Exiguobacterium antarcticum]|uniref:ribbon-helix-helix domain-containing protein n=1 Tax=Exiguobacterium antarcticum TaxID=132920 RepID=UPI00249A99B3|nr:CopG family transcriptional regulator [Exiguobacterium antarcticum]
MTGIEGGDGLNKRVHIYLTEEVLKEVDNLSEEYGINRSNLIEKACIQYVENETKESVKDSIVADLTRALDNALDPKIERLAKLISKGAVFSGMSQNLLIEYLDEATSFDVLASYRNARLKTVEDLKRPLEALMGGSAK